MSLTRAPKKPRFVTKVVAIQFPTSHSSLFTASPPPPYLSQVFEFFKVGKMEIWDIGRIESPAAPPLFQYCFEILTHFPFRLCLQKTKTQKTKKDNDNDRFQNDEFTRGSSLSIKRIKCKVSYFSILSIDHFLKDTFFVIILKRLKYQKTKIQINHCM